MADSARKRKYASRPNRIKKKNDAVARSKRNVIQRRDQHDNRIRKTIDTLKGLDLDGQDSIDRDLDVLRLQKALDNGIKNRKRWT